MIFTAVAFLAVCALAFWVALVIYPQLLNMK